MKHRDGSLCRLVARYSKESDGLPVGAGWVIDSDGNRVEDFWYKEDGYNRHKSKLRRIEEFYLGPLPAIRSSDPDTAEDPPGDQ